MKNKQNPHNFNIPEKLSIFSIITFNGSENKEVLPIK